MMNRPLALVSLSVALAPFASAVDLAVPGTYPTIQAAVNVAQPGDVILIGKGKYEPALIDGKTDLTLKRSGGKVIVNVGFDDEAGIRILNSSGISISGLDVRGGFSEGIWATFVDDLTITDCRFKKTGDGVALEVCDDVLIEDCSFRTKLDGIYMSTGSGVTVRDCVFKGLKGGPAVYSNDVDQVSVVDCRATNVDEGFYLNDADGSMVVGCRVKKVKTWLAIDVQGVGVTVMDNVVKKAKGDESFVVLGDGAVVTGNKLLKSSEGVYVSGAGATVSGNGVKKCVRGLEVDSDAATVSGNDVSGSKQFGVRVRGFSNDVESNEVRKNGTNGMEIEGSGNAVTANVGKKNKHVDLYDESGVGANTYVDNDFGKILIEGGEEK